MLERPRCSGPGRAQTQTLFFPILMSVMQSITVFTHHLSHFTQKFLYTTSCISTYNSVKRYLKVYSLALTRTSHHKSTPSVRASVKYITTLFEPNTVKYIQNLFLKFYDLHLYFVGRVAQSVKRLTTGSTVRDRIPVGKRFSAHRDQPWGPPSLL